MYIGLAVLVALLLLCLLSKSVRKQFKFLTFPLLLIIGGCLAYYLVTGNSPLAIPGMINDYFGDPQLQDEPSHKYYQDPKRYKLD